MPAIIYARLYTDNYHVDGEFVVDNEKLSFTDYDNTIDIPLNSIFAVVITDNKLYCKLIDSVDIPSIDGNYIILDIENMEEFYSNVLSNITGIPIINTGSDVTSGATSNIYVREDADFSMLLQGKPISLYPLYYRHKGAYIVCKLEAHTNGFIFAHKPHTYPSKTHSIMEKVFRRILYNDINFIQLKDDILQFGDITAKIYVDTDLGQAKANIKSTLVRLIKRGIPIPILF